MKFSINKKDVAGHLQVLSDIAQKNTTKDVISNTLVIADKSNGQAIFKVTNFELSFEARIPAEVETEGRTCVNAGHLVNIFREVSEEKISFELKDNNWLQIKLSKSMMKLPGLDVAMFPEVQFDKLPNSFMVNWKDWQKGLGYIVFAIGDNPSRKNLMGMNLKVKEGKAKLLASDAYRMAIYDLEITDVEGGNCDIIIPKKNVQEFRKLQVSDSQKIKVSYNERFFQIETGNVMMKSTLIEAAFPDLTKVLFDEAQYNINFSASAVLERLKLLRIFMSEINPVTKITFEGSSMRFESDKNDVGESVHDIDCLYDGEKVSIGFNIRFLLENLQVFEDQPVAIRFRSKESPAIISTPSDQNYVSVIMPVKIEW